MRLIFEQHVHVCLQKDVAAGAVADLFDHAIALHIPAGLDHGGVVSFRGPKSRKKEVKTQDVDRMQYVLI